MLFLSSLKIRLHVDCGMYTFNNNNNDNNDDDNDDDDDDDEEEEEERKRKPHAQERKKKQGGKKEEGIFPALWQGPIYNTSMCPLGITAVSTNTICHKVRRVKKEKRDRCSKKYRRQCTLGYRRTTVQQARAYVCPPQSIRVVFARSGAEGKACKHINTSPRSTGVTE